MPWCLLNLERIKLYLHKACVYSIFNMLKKCKNQLVDFIYVTISTNTIQRIQQKDVDAITIKSCGSNLKYSQYGMIYFLMKAHFINQK